MFSDLKIAFKGKTNGDLKFAAFMFRIMASPFTSKLATNLATFTVKYHFPFAKAIIKSTMFRQFCGGENMEECLTVLHKLEQNNVKVILDYSVEGEQNEKDFDATKKEIINAIKFAKSNPNIPVSCVKLSGIGRFSIYEKLSAKTPLTNLEQNEYTRIEQRLNELCKTAVECNTPLYIDAEESWVQQAIDDLAEQMILKYNNQKAYVFNTLQMYRWDRLEVLKKNIEQAKDQNVIWGLKIVRGAYLEQENDRAITKNYPTPIQSSKKNTDTDYDLALALILDNIENMELCAGTHNAQSAEYLTQLMAKKGVQKNHPHIYFSQLYGMSDHISNNLAHLGYNVSKYLPYGPVASTLPYLVRRAEENTSIAGQVSDELDLVEAEIARRR